MTESVAVAIVAYDDSATLEQCVQSLRASFDGPIVIVNNHSTDATGRVADRLCAELSDIRVIHASHNNGYAAGGNLARAATDTAFLAVMNADCIATGDWITPCVDIMEATDGVGGCSPTVALADESGINAEGLTLHIAGFGFNRHLGWPMAEASSVPGPVQGLQGTAFVIRTSALDRIGGWYTGGFLYHEDVELSWSLRGAGYDIWHVPTPAVVHDYHLTMSAEKFFLLERNRIEMLLGHLRLGTRIVIAPVIAATEAAVWAYAIAKRSGLVRAKWRSYRSVIERSALHRVRRLTVRTNRSVSDLSLLRQMQLSYPRTQTQTLLTEATSSGRRGNRSMPTE